MMSSSTDVLMVVNGVITIILACSVLFVKTDWLLRVYSALLILLLPMYRNLELFSHPEDMLSPEGMVDMWVRHSTFYVALFFLFLFTTRMFDHALEKEMSTTKAKMPIAVMTSGLFVFFGIIVLFTMEMLRITNLPFTFHNLNYFLTEHGIQHIVVLVFFFFSLATIRTYSLYPSYTATRNFLLPMVAAGGSFVCLHVFEYFYEILNVFPFIDEEMGEHIEFVFQYLGVALLVVAVGLLFKLGDIKKLRVTK